MGVAFLVDRIRGIDTRWTTQICLQNDLLSSTLVRTELSKMRKMYELWPAHTHPAIYLAYTVFVYWIMDIVVTQIIDEQRSVNNACRRSAAVRGRRPYAKHSAVAQGVEDVLCSVVCDSLWWVTSCIPHFWCCRVRLFDK
ncbi:unnamed protein product [Toxocara canis]|uniref:Bestrophin homolog n=1 Tax=Toxocara canis TaxID=6265 RepID=A0A183TWK3_TOXCA|nr:unnamed protein product [Toxocara canis]